MNGNGRPVWHRLAREMRDEGFTVRQIAAEFDEDIDDVEFALSTRVVARACGAPNPAHPSDHVTFYWLERERIGVQAHHLLTTKSARPEPAAAEAGR